MTAIFQRASLAKTIGSPAHDSSSPEGGCVRGAQADFLNQTHGLCIIPVSNVAQSVFCNRELVSAVLSHVPDFRDLTACSAVSKCWHAAAASLQSLAPQISQSFLMESLPHPTEGMLHSMQQKQKRNGFDQVQMLKLQVETQPAEDCIEHNKNLSVFGSAPLMMAGLWPLCERHITGCFELGWVIALLPSGVQHLHVDLNLSLPDSEGCHGPVNVQQIQVASIPFGQFHKCRTCGQPRANGLPLIPV